MNDWLSRVVEQEPLKRHTYFRIGGPAAYLARPETLEDAREILVHYQERGLPVFILGLGANVLVQDEGFEGLVMCLKQGAFQRIFRTDEGLRAGAGASLGKLLQEAHRQGLAGLEGLVGVPGTVGGAVAMNAGGHYGNIGNRVKRAAYLATDGTLKVRTAQELSFGYRSSNLGDGMLFWVDFALEQDSSERIMERMKEILGEKKRTQPLRARSAGCVFKNPPGSHAGALIDQAGLKGLSVGAAQVSPKHANFIVNTDNASSKEVIELIELVRERVREKFGVQLELELVIVPTR